MNRYFKAEAKGVWRRKLAPAVLLVGLASAFKLTYDASPREQRVLLQLPDPLRAGISSVRVTYLEDNVAISGTEQRFVDGAPATLTSHPELAPGSYRLHVELAGRDGST